MRLRIYLGLILVILAIAIAEAKNEVKSNKASSPIQRSSKVQRRKIQVAQNGRPGKIGSGSGSAASNQQSVNKADGGNGGKVKNVKKSAKANPMRVTNGEMVSAARLEMFKRGKSTLQNMASVSNAAKDGQILSSDERARVQLSANYRLEQFESMMSSGDDKGMFHHNHGSGYGGHRMFHTCYGLNKILQLGELSMWGEHWKNNNGYGNHNHNHDHDHDHDHDRRKRGVEEEEDWEDWDWEAWLDGIDWGQWSEDSEDSDDSDSGSEDEDFGTGEDSWEDWDEEDWKDWEGWDWNEEDWKDWDWNEEDWDWTDEDWKDWEDSDWNDWGDDDWDYWDWYYYYYDYPGVEPYPYHCDPADPSCEMCMNPQNNELDDETFDYLERLHAQMDRDPVTGIRKFNCKKWMNHWEWKEKVMDKGMFCPTYFMAECYQFEECEEYKGCYEQCTRQPYCPVNDTKGGWWNKHKDHIFEMFIKDAEECKMYMHQLQKHDKDAEFWVYFITDDEDAKNLEDRDKKANLRRFFAENEDYIDEIMAILNDKMDERDGRRNSALTSVKVNSAASTLALTGLAVVLNKFRLV